MSELPFNRALLKASREQASRLAELEAENARLAALNARLVVTTTNLRRRLVRARESQGRWLLRQQAWRAERDGLLQQIPENMASLVALREWGPEDFVP